MRLPYAAIIIADGEQKVLVASMGTAGRETIHYPLRYQSEVVGGLLVAPRAPGEAFSQADERVLRNLARQAGPAVYAFQLTEQLRRSRQRIVTAREEERRRLRRDLHDGLGPQLASQALGMEAVAKLMASNPEKAQELLRALQAQAQEAILDIRRLVYDLRPPALDQLGVAGALQESAHRYETGALHFTFEASGLGDLPAAVEVAAYRIAQEAMTNVVHHAAATACSVRLFIENEALIVEIEDNGRGLPPGHKAGVGLLSMQERAAELNGRCIIESRDRQGALVRAELPLE
jgi:signal transduction histidine kinase